MLEQGWVIICGVLTVIGLFNLGMILSVLSHQGRQRPYLNGSIADILNPWKKEEEALSQLHEQVVHLADNKQPEKAETPDE